MRTEIGPQFPKVSNGSMIALFGRSFGLRDIIHKRSDSIGNVLIKHQYEMSAAEAIIEMALQNIAIFGANKGGYSALETGINRYRAEVSRIPRVGQSIILFNQVILPWFPAKISAFS